MIKKIKGGHCWDLYAMKIHRKSRLKWQCGSTDLIQTQVILVCPRHNNKKYYMYWNGKSISPLRMSENVWRNLSYFANMVIARTIKLTVYQVNAEYFRIFKFFPCMYSNFHLYRMRNKLDSFISSNRKTDSQQHEILST